MAKRRRKDGKPRRVRVPEAVVYGTLPNKAQRRKLWLKRPTINAFAKEIGTAWAVAKRIAIEDGLWKE